MPKNSIRKLSYDKISYSKTSTVWTSLACSSFPPHTKLGLQTMLLWGSSSMQSVISPRCPFIWSALWLHGWGGEVVCSILMQIKGIFTQVKMDTFLDTAPTSETTFPGSRHLVAIQNNWFCTNYFYSLQLRFSQDCIIIIIITIHCNINCSTAVQ
jgi:hypothetical protein